MCCLFIIFTLKGNHVLHSYMNNSRSISHNWHFILKMFTKLWHHRIGIQPLESTLASWVLQMDKAKLSRGQ